MLPLKRAETKDEIAKYSPSGKVPLLIDGDVRVWESLAIIEYLVEKFPGQEIWPKYIDARAHARAISNEMHGGFIPLRQALPMNLGGPFKTPALSDDVKANVARMEAIWRDTRDQYGKGGPFLFGAFSAADAMYAPVVTRLQSYQIPVDAGTRRYMDDVLGTPALQQWTREALAEPWKISEYELKP